MGSDWISSPCMTMRSCVSSAAASQMSVGMVARRNSWPPPGRAMPMRCGPAGVLKSTRRECVTVLVTCTCPCPPNSVVSTQMPTGWNASVSLGVGQLLFADPFCCKVENFSRSFLAQMQNWLYSFDVLYSFGMLFPHSWWERAEVSTLVRCIRYQVKKFCLPLLRLCSPQYPPPHVWFNSARCELDISAHTSNVCD